MPAVKKKLLIEQRAAFKLNLTWKDAKNKPVNLTGWTARLQVRPEFGSSTVLLDASTDNGRITLGGVAGTIAVVVSDEVTKDLAFESAVYDLKMTPPDGESIRLIEGTVALSPGVTE